MPEINLFKISNKDTVEEIQAKPVLLEKDLQNLIELNMEQFFGVTFVKSEYTMTNGRIDSLGLDENNCPVIFEYKRHSNENVINQDLFYLDWLLDHKADFRYLVETILGKEKADKIDWGVPCVMCIANDFTKYDEHAVNQMQKNIKLIRYKKFDDELILFEHINTPKVNFKSISRDKSVTNNENCEKMENKYSNENILKQIETSPKYIKDLLTEISDYILSKGEEVTEDFLKHYIAYKKVKNIVCLQISKKNILLYLKLNPNNIEKEEGFSRDMTGVGHYGTGNLQVTINRKEDFEKAKKYIDMVYESN
ncbi:MAG: endonuclease NucS domain-containing protein [Fusobacteriaceae bacterium]